MSPGDDLPVEDQGSFGDAGAPESVLAYFDPRYSARQALRAISGESTLAQARAEDALELSRERLTGAPDSDEVDVSRRSALGTEAVRPVPGPVESAQMRDDDAGVEVRELSRPTPEGASSHRE